MKIHPVPVIAIWLLLTLQSAAQQAGPPSFRILLKNGSIDPVKNISAEQMDVLNSKAARVNGKTLWLVQFEKIPGATERKSLSAAGIELLDYIPNFAYTVSARNAMDASVLQKAGARAVLELGPEQKMEPSLSTGVFPSWSVKIGGTVDVWISFPKTFSADEVTGTLRSMNFDLLSDQYKKYRILALRVPANRLFELAALPCIDYLQPAPAGDRLLNYKSTANSRATILQSAAGRNLRGQGVVIGVGDNTDPQTHIDFTNRLVPRSPQPYVNGGSSHGTHVTGTAAGAGIANEIFTGYAPKAKIVSQAFSGIIANASTYVNDYGMVLTNNSYGDIDNDCHYFGLYDLTSRLIDQMAYDLPTLQNVFATGNSGAFSCAPYPAGFQTVLGSYQSAKNVINVGNTFNTSLIYTNSSRGPVKDGRIKPEICALGEAVLSAIGPTPDNYGAAWGTSMASPAVTGGSALLYERYRQLNGNANPPGGLVKAFICNGGTDLGNAGPDFTYGFGWLNLLRSVEMLENNHYVVSTVANGGSNNHSITVPANTAAVKVMLYWHDPAAAALSSQTLVNDLDLELRDPSSVLTLPYVLDTVPANVNNPATTGVDHINNIEQAVINAPVAGTYTVTVKGTAITQNPSQEYYVVYDFLPIDTRVTFPSGGEKLNPGETHNIQWDSWGSPANTFTLEYSLNNGSTWTLIDNNVAANLRQYAWTIPAALTEQARVRVTRNSTALVSTGQAFTIATVPTASLAATQCEGYIALQWSAVAGATDYEVMMLRGDDMRSVGTTTATNYTFSGLSKDSVYWVAVRPRVNGFPGRRSGAISRQPNTGTCSGTISDNDMKIDALLAPQSGRLLTSSALGVATVISVRVKNLDDAAIASFNIKYSVNGGAFVSEAAPGAIGAGATYTHNFAATYDFSATGIYTVRVVVQNTAATDPVPANDTLTVIVKQLPNNPITLVTGSDFLDNLETAVDSSYRDGQVGMAGADRYDFRSSTVYGRARTFINSGLAYSGSRALTLDADRFNAGGTADSLKATFNLLPHFNTADDIRLDFRYKHHGQGPDAANQVWIRGNDMSPWIAVYDLYANQPDIGIFRKIQSIELSDILNANSQDFSTSFQVRFGQQGILLAADNSGGAGYTFDDIHLYKVDNDLQMISLDTPVVASCGLGANVPVRITARNSADTSISNIPVRFSVDGGPITTEMIATIAGNTNSIYAFTATADLSAVGMHIVKVWVDYPGDSFRDNDTVTVAIRNSPVIASFPYIENFEGGDGYWYSGGKNNSWEYGTPSAQKINRAASGSRAWKTNLTGTYHNQELSYLYSPCFNISGMTNPTLSLSIALDLEDCGSGPTDLCDGAYVEYSADGIAWTRLGANGQGVNWYNKAYTGNHLWSVEDYTNWHVATIPLPAGYTKLRLRFVITSDPFVTREGIAVDDIHIYDNTYGIYEGAPFTSNTISIPAVSGSGWFDFTDGGKLVASVNPNGQNMGVTTARTYINTSAVRTNNGQYYHDRNITIKPANRNLGDSATVRFYFLDSETENLINATGCPTCTKPSMAYELGVSKYNDADTSKENGTLADNLTMGWSFIPPPNVIKVPFDKGYYAEFRVKDFSEFWLNNGGLNNNQSLPVELLSFTARKKDGRDVIAEWKTASEQNVDHFEIEVAKGNEEYRQNHFFRIGAVASQGNATSAQTYAFTDVESGKSGVRYYRLKMVDHDGRFAYSAVRPVMFDSEVNWQVYPNPSPGPFSLVYQAAAGSRVSLKVYDLKGRLVIDETLQATGFEQKHSIDLEGPKYTPGLYLVEVNNGGNKQVFRLVKQ